MKGAAAAISPDAMPPRIPDNEKILKAYFPLAARGWEVWIKGVGLSGP
jgi:hypothetical protein